MKTSLDIIDDVSHCPAYYQLLVKSLTLPGLLEIRRRQHARRIW